MKRLSNPSLEERREVLSRREKGSSLSKREGKFSLEDFPPTL
jgi:hypothetical protein